MPAAQASRPYRTPEGVSMGACLYGGRCMNTGCEVSAKAVPQTTVLPAAYGRRGLGTAIADFDGDNFDPTGLGLIGGCFMACPQLGRGPLMHQPAPPGTPNRGAAWKKAMAPYDNRSC